ncbi:Hypothetical predicted protein [Mytilus galloprovincialis]|uniref:Uncharacterized protein n=1 Tax=Mytilus galloprovincialis TaxID=29158 RepID=A0A8B6H0D9_MYTGA|nr:Hypothetical predicted protein [Mytilus galloprovincialis]
MSVIYEQFSAVALNIRVEQLFVSVVSCYPDRSAPKANQAQLLRRNANSKDSSTQLLKPDNFNLEYFEHFGLLNLYCE